MVVRSNSSGHKRSARRERLRGQGLRPIQMWVPDTQAPAFKAEAHRQSAVVAASTHVDDDQAFIDAITSLQGLRRGSYHQYPCADGALLLPVAQRAPPAKF